MLPRAQRLLFAFIPLVALLVVAEAGQRVRYFFRFGQDTYWLTYGFRPSAERNSALFQAGLVGQPVAGAGPAVIEVPRLQYDSPHGRYIKYNPRYPWQYRINTHGFRGREFSVEKPPATIRVVALGGSTTFSIAVDDDDKTWPLQLERQLNAAAGRRRFEVINAGVSSATLPEIIALLDQEVRTWQPDVVVVSCVFNNLYFLTDQVPSGLSRVDAWFRRTSLVYTTAGEKIVTMLGKPAGVFHDRSVRDLEQEFAPSNGFWSRLEADYATLARRVAAAGATLVLVKEPVLLHDSTTYAIFDERLRPAWERAFAIVDRVGARHAVPVVDAFGEIDRRGDRTALFMDGVHLNERGDRLISELIFAAIHDRAW